MVLGRQVGRFLPPAVLCGGHVALQFVIFGLGLVCVLVGGMIVFCQRTNLEN